MRVGFVGLGNMGGPMALNLMKAGHTLVVHDVREATAATHLERGAKWAASPREAAEGAELKEKAAEHYRALAVLAVSSATRPELERARRDVR